jgi:hypothetical protein
MATKRKTSEIRFISRHILHQHRYVVPSLYQSVETRNIQVMTVVSATSAPPFQPLRHQRNVCHQGGILADRTDASPGCKKFPLQCLDSLLGCSGLYGVWHCHDEPVPLSPVGLEVSCELHQLRTVRRKIQSHHASENGLTVLPDESQLERIWKEAVLA